MSTTATVSAPSLECGCGRVIELGARKIGDSVTCPGCSKLCVVIRSRTKGEIPTAIRSGGLTSGEKREVSETLRRIKLRRVGHATRHVKLYPSWAVFLSGVQFYLSAILAGQNLINQGDPKRGKRLQLIGVVSYVVLGALLMVAGFMVESVPPALKAVVALSVPLFFGLYFTWSQHASCAAARDAGAGTAPVGLPLLVGLILAIAQAFAVWFLKLQIDGPFVG
jgi:hypothetical protein